MNNDNKKAINIILEKIDIFWDHSDLKDQGRFSNKIVLNQELKIDWEINR